ncbi:arachidonate 5-lipoxygenase-like [Actinia tenebrosa]|uniref:Arachidonate 5-lipoxygenase-like n=1 Tax=Actinia tenebrosa TaxID=6105 RepID=A0A6P8H9R8_ACTTE|nr:arachidonate 5-lipoxygenase-like [Actinia tenebrosa]
MLILLLYIGSVGADWDYLKTRLNNSYQWETAVQDAIGMDISLKEAIKTGYLYIVHYPLLDDVPTKNETSPVHGRKLMKAVSPIALFASKPSRNKKQPNQLVPFAIQMGHTKDSDVATPNDGDKWLLAKQTVQVADFVYAGSVEHLLKTHLFIEPICVAMLRHFHSLHPLHQLLKFHCRGVSGTNKFNINNLTGRNSTSDLLFAVGYPGGYQLLRRSFEASSWDDADFVKNIKRRGMNNNNKVPYYPYRDDGLLIYKSIKNMVCNYVHFFYRKSCQVESDPELQAFANEVSAEGNTPPDGGKGMIKGFPSSIKTRRQLVDMLTPLIWTTSAQHSAINYPSNYYGSYTPNMPTKLYHDSRVNDDNFDLFNLPGKRTAAVQVALGMNLASLRYDRLLDYSDELQHINASKIVKRHSQRLNGYTATVIESRNRKRYQERHLTYPYLVPGWITNSIHT